MPNGSIIRHYISKKYSSGKLSKMKTRLAVVVVVVVVVYATYVVVIIIVVVVSSSLIIIHQKICTRRLAAVMYSVTVLLSPFHHFISFPPSNPTK